ncbi:hypothetical protein F8388_018582 [Cannabis sativa]|uniref:acid phosphatase n=1 Tax=Cannabis sativa TaxID=3483 RepID=A0A7J6FCV8_CANSA|nr:hypothetical protein F8388_018582 [Cannabis sativa]
MMKMKMVMLWLLFIVSSISSGSSTRGLPRLEQAAKEDGSLSILVLGDWGRRGHYNQSQVAYQMGIIGEKLDIDFVISTGDNFYESGLKGVDDPAFQESFTNIYTAPSLQKPWYTVLGNHDYRGDVEAQLSPVLRKLDSKWICMRSFIVDTEIAEFFFVDTTPFVDKYFLEPKDDENNVDVYMNGHDHCLQHITSMESPIQFFTSGGGSKAWRGEISWWNPNEMKFYYDGQGFMSAHFTSTHAHFQFYDIFGNVLHKSTTYKPLFYSATATTI